LSKITRKGKTPLGRKKGKGASYHQKKKKKKKKKKSKGSVNGKGRIHLARKGFWKGGRGLNSVPGGGRTATRKTTSAPKG